MSAFILQFQDSQLSMVDPCESEKEFSLHVTVNPAPYQNVIPYTSDLYQLAMDSEEELTQWWRGLQQHMLDQGIGGGRGCKNTCWIMILGVKEAVSYTYWGNGTLNKRNYD